MPAASCNLAPGWSLGGEWAVLGEDLLRQRLPSSSSQAGAAFRHREPSCQLPQRKMGSPGTGVHVVTALGVLCFCLAGEGRGARWGWRWGRGSHSRLGSCGASV